MNELAPNKRKLPSFRECLAPLLCRERYNDKGNIEILTKDAVSIRRSGRLVGVAVNKANKIRAVIQSRKKLGRVQLKEDIGLGMDIACAKITRLAFVANDESAAFSRKVIFCVKQNLFTNVRSKAERWHINNLLGCFRGKLRKGELRRDGLRGGAYN